LQNPILTAPSRSAQDRRGAMAQPRHQEADQRPYTPATTRGTFTLDGEPVTVKSAKMVTDTQGQVTLPQP
jgi:hypothetical protein